VQETCIPFLDESDELVIIEPLPGFANPAKRLREGVTTSEITALITGKVRTRPTDMPQCFEWLPRRLLTLLGLACGSECGAPWLEFRDSSGQLSKRIHYSMGSFRFDPGISPMSPSHGGMGALLSIAMRHMEAEYDRIWVALRHVVRAGSSFLHMEERITHLCQALDGLYRYLCERENQTTRNASGQIFGGKVLAITDAVGLADRETLENLEATHPHAFPKPWTEFISELRGNAVHEGFLKIDTQEEYDLAVATFRHLYDLSLRSIFMLLGFQGPYKPVVLVADSRPTNWLDPSRPEDLHYDH
jgi:hypothetical protein